LANPVYLEGLIVSAWFQVSNHQGWKNLGYMGKVIRFFRLQNYAPGKTSYTPFSLPHIAFYKL